MLDSLKSMGFSDLDREGSRNVRRRWWRVSKSRRLVIVTGSVLLGSLFSVAQVPPGTIEMLESADDCSVLSDVLADPGFSSTLSAQFTALGPCVGEFGKLVDRPSPHYRGRFVFGEPTSPSSSVSFAHLVSPGSVPDRFVYSLTSGAGSSLSTAQMYIAGEASCRFLAFVLDDLPPEALDLFAGGYAITRAYVFPDPTALTPSQCVLFAFSSGVDRAYLRVWATFDGSSFGPLQTD